VVNLVTNAIKFTPHNGHVALGAQRVGSNVRIWVSDTGPGIAPEKQGKLFVEFARLDTTLPDGEKPKGSGLGLSIVKRIAEAHDGSVSVRSAPGDGAVFMLTLPAADPEPQDADPPAEQSPARDESTSTPDDAQVSPPADRDNLTAGP
jgi:signal transduction histidine kinase